MSRRKGPPRGVKGVNKYAGLSDSDISEDDMNLMQVFETLLQRNREHRKRQRTTTTATKKRPTPAKRTRRNLNITVAARCETQKKMDGNKKRKNGEKSSENLINCDSDEEKTDINISENVSTDHLKQIENKVNNFFKSHNLLSDDDDDEEIVSISSNKTPQAAKQFYELSDSDEEYNKILKSTNSEKPIVTSTSPGPSGSKVNDSTNKSDELMDIVDKILVCDDSITDLTNNEPNENWMKMKNKAQDMLGSINNLLNEIDEKTKPPEDPKSSPEKARPTCPICLEQIGGDTLMMTTICGHIFCKCCITKVAKTSKCCPTCRKPVNLQKIHAVYL